MDKRHLAMKSSNMEKQALHNSLTRIRSILKVVEVCTNSSATIKKTMGMFHLHCSLNMSKTEMKGSKVPNMQYFILECAFPMFNDLQYF